MKNKLHKLWLAGGTHSFLGKYVQLEISTTTQ